LPSLISAGLVGIISLRAQIQEETKFSKVTVTLMQQVDNSFQRI